MFQHALKFLTWFSACLEIFNIVFNTMVHNIGEFQNSTKECRSILRDEASVYFNVTAVHV